MKKSHFFLLCLVLSSLKLNAAQASALDFDYVTADAEAAIADGYGGLNWSNFWVQNPELGQVPDFDSGFYNGVISKGYTAFNANGNPAVMSSSDPFDFNSAWFAAASRWELEITATGYRNGSPLFQQQFTVNTDLAQLVTLNFSGIDRLVFTSSGGREHIGSGYHFTMDNATINAVPEPATTWLFCSALIGLAGMARRKSA